jgi:hypothetical protein
MTEDSGIESKLVGRGVVDPHGYKIGTIDALFVHGDRDVPNWARVKMGIFGKDSALVPLQDAQEDGDDVRLVYEKEHVKAAPEVEPDDQELSDEAADKLHGHYGLERVLGLTVEGSEDEMELPRETREAKPPGMEEGEDSPLTQRRRERQQEIEEVARDFEQTKDGESQGADSEKSQGADSEESQGADSEKSPGADDDGSTRPERSEPPRADQDESSRAEDDDTQHSEQEKAT